MTNLNTNKANLVLTEVDLAKIYEAIEVLQALLPNLTLTDEERKSLVSMDVHNKIFAADVLQLLEDGSSAFVPGYINVDHLRNDLTFIDQMDRIHSKLLHVTRKVTDAMRTASSEAMAVAFSAYTSISIAEKAGISGAKEPKLQLTKRFKKAGRKPNTDL